MSSVPILLVTANVGSIFEDPTEMLKLWAEEFLSKIAGLDLKFIALHCQEVGGKNYEKSMKHVERFVKLLTESKELKPFSRSRVFLDEDYTSVEHFTALGNLYFIHNSVENALLWDFKKSQFISVLDSQVFSGNIEAVDTKEKAKFPQNFFPECKWSRKGFMRTRWSLCGTVFDLVNIHLFHDASNLVAMSTTPSVYCRNRQRALEHTLYKFHNDHYDKAPCFVFGDFNFRTDNEGVIKKLSTGLTKKRVQNTKNNEHTKLHFTNDENNLILTIGKKEFSHSEHGKIFLNYEWLKMFDKETETFSNILKEYPISFAPSYPFEEDISKGNSYMPTRCPAWCDRVLFNPSSQKIISEEYHPDYGLIGLNTCMGDHKPVFLRIALKANAGTVKCCDHALFVSLPETCQCCQTFASVTINVIDMSDQKTSYSKSLTNISIDFALLHEPQVKGMSSREPYTPESSDSHSPLPEESEVLDIQEQSRRNSVSPTQLKSKLENIIMLNNTFPLIKHSSIKNNNSDFTKDFLPQKTSEFLQETKNVSSKYTFSSLSSTSVGVISIPSHVKSEQCIKKDSSSNSNSSSNKKSFIPKSSLSLEPDEVEFKKNYKKCCSIA